MGSPKAGSPAIDQAREIVCRAFARLMAGGSSSVRIRIVKAAGQPSEAWFYGRGNDGWQKESGAVTDPELVRALEETVAMLASKGHCDEWTVRQHGRADHQDIDVVFHREKIEQAGKQPLEATVMSLLFRDSHESKKSARRSIRTPR